LAAFDLPALAAFSQLARALPGTGVRGQKLI
jgi:hypothetical protein